ncbi:MAG TPA: hypothetical protein VI159_01660 [Gemmatimonadales bacterium]
MTRARSPAGAVCLILLIAGAGSATACTSWKPEAISPAGAPAIDSTKTYRVRLADGTSRFVQHARVERDSLVWFIPVPEAAFAPPFRRAVALADVQGVDTPHAAPLGNFFAVYLSVAFVLALIRGLNPFPHG